MITYGYIRTRTASSPPESQAIQLRQAGVPPERVYREVEVSGRTGARSAEAAGHPGLPANG